MRVSIPKAGGHRARANYMLHRNFASLGYVEQSEACTRITYSLRADIEGHEGGIEKDWGGSAKRREREGMFW